MLARIFGIAFSIAVSFLALAIPVQLTFSGTVTGSNLSGVNNGDAIVFKVFADNGEPAKTDKSGASQT